MTAQLWTMSVDICVAAQLNHGVDESYTLDVPKNGDPATIKVREPGYEWCFHSRCLGYLVWSRAIGIYSIMFETVVKVSFADSASFTGEKRLGCSPIDITPIASEDESVIGK